MDEAARLEYARDEGRQEGVLLGRLALLLELLGNSQPTREELLAYNLSQLTTLAKQLQQQLSPRGE